MPPGASFEELCERITRGLLSFRDATTGEPLIAAVERGIASMPTASHGTACPISSFVGSKRRQIHT